jgi:hypothetical protein
VRSTVTSGAMNPYPLLEWIKANGAAITGGSDARYCEAPRAGGPIPFTGESRWPAAGSPGVSPDLDTGSNDPAPSPAVENPERQIDHASGAAPAQQGEPAPPTDPRTTGPPSSGSPNPPAPHDETPPGALGDEPPPASNGESAQGRSDAPIPKADPEGDKASDPPGEEQKPSEDGEGEKAEDGKDAPINGGEEQEDPQSPDEQASPVEDQYAPETGESGAESDLETTASR